MDREKYLEKLRKEIEVVKKNAIGEIQREEMIPGIWSISTLVDLKAQEILLQDIMKKEES